jgi:hypothetical protein
MPFLLPAAATAVAAAAPAAAATTAAATAGATLTSIATNIAMNVAISAVMSALQPQVGAAGRTAEWTLSPDGPIPFAAGRIGVAGSVVHRATFGPDLMYLGVPAVLSGAGPIDGYESFKADDEWVNFDGNGKATSSQYAGELWYRRTMGYQPDVAVASPPGLKSNATLPGWGAQHKLSGKAAYMVVMGENSKGTAFPTGEIKPLITLRGLKGWDPRLDSTWPGGNGPCRLDNPATWVYLRRPGLWGLKWSLGLWEGPTLKGAPAHGSATDHQVGGIGAKLSGIDVAAFVNLENICDANDWTVSAYPTTDDDKFAVLESFLQAGGATFAMRAGKISCIQRAAPRASIVTISAADTAGPLEIDTAASRIDRINTIRPRIMSEAHRWQMTAITEVSAQAYRDQDGGVRPRGIDYTYVDKATQGAQLAALQIANTREGIAGIIPLKPHLQKIKPGDAFTITEPGFVLNGLKCLCLSTEFDPATKIVAVSFVSETDAKYAFALGQSQEPPAPAELEPVDPRYVSPPGETEWEIVARPPAEGGAQVPGFDLVGEVDNATATALLVEWGPTAEGPWTQAYMGPPTAERIPITGVQPNAVYYVSTMNIRGQNYSQRRVFGPFTAPPLVSNDTVNVGDMPAGDVAEAASQVPTLALTLAGAQLAIATHEATLNTAVTGVVARIAALVPAIFDPTTGLQTRMGTVESTVAVNNSIAVSRIAALEASDRKGGATLPYSLSDGGLNWIESYGGDPDVITSVGSSGGRTYPSVAGVGKVMQITLPDGGGSYTSTRGAMKIQAGHKYRVTVRARRVGGSASSALYPYAMGLTESWALFFAPYAYRQLVVDGQWYEQELTINGDDALAAGAVWLRGCAHVSAIGGATTFQVDYCKTEDVTDVASLSARAFTAEAALIDLENTKAESTRVALLEAAQTVNANLTRNPSGYETLPGNGLGAAWSTDYTNDWFFYEPTPGNGYRQCGVGSTSGNRNAYSQTPVDANQALTFSVDVYCSGGPGTQAAATISGWNGSAFTVSKASNYIAGGVWTRLSVHITAAEAAGLQYVYPGVSANLNSGAVAFRRAKLEYGPVATAFTEERTQLALLSRAATLETAVTSLQSGKADVSRVNLLEARAAAGGNLLVKSQFFGADDYPPWGGGNAGINGYNPRVFVGDNIRAPAGEFAYLMQEVGTGNDSYAETNSPLTAVTPGARICFSLYAGADNAHASMFVYWADASGALVGNTAGSGGDTWCYAGQGAVNGSAAVESWKRLYSFATVPAGVAYVMLVYRRYGRLNVGQGYSNIWMLRPMVAEVSTTATQPPPWSPSSASATVFDVRQATATLKGRLESRALLVAQAGNQVAGMQLLAASGDVSYSTIDFWASAVRISNGGSNPTAPFVVRDNQVRIQELLVDRVAVGASIVVGSRRLALAVQPFAISVTDGVPATFGYNIGQEPTIVFLRDGAIQTPGSAESYDFTAEAPTGNGFTPRLKIKTATAPANVTHGPGGHSSGGGIDFYYALNSGRANTTVNVRSTGVIQYQWVNNRFDSGHIPEYEEQPGYEWDRYTEGYLVLQTKIYNGSVWRDGPPIEVYPPPLNSGTTGLRTSSYDTGDVAITVNPGDTHVGISLAYESHAGSYVSDLRLGYQTAGASGVRSATPNGELTTAMVYPRNAA